MKKHCKILILLLVIAAVLTTTGPKVAYGKNITYVYEVFPLDRNGINLHLDCVKLENSIPTQNILLIHH